MTEVDDNEGVFTDDDGYPTDWGITQLRQFAGTPAEFVELVQKLWWIPSLITISDGHDDRTAVKTIRLVTGGWSGNEEVIAELDRTYFALRYWQSSHRGGLHVYQVPAQQWNIATDCIGALPVAHQDT